MHEMGLLKRAFSFKSLHFSPKPIRRGLHVQSHLYPGVNISDICRHLWDRWYRMTFYCLVFFFYQDRAVYFSSSKLFTWNLLPLLVAEVQRLLSDLAPYAVTQEYTLRRHDLAWCCMLCVRPCTIVFTNILNVASKRSFVIIRVSDVNRNTCTTWNLLNTPNLLTTRSLVLKKRI